MEKMDEQIERRNEGLDELAEQRQKNDEMIKEIENIVDHMNDTLTDVSDTVKLTNLELAEFNKYMRGAKNLSIHTIFTILAMGGTGAVLQIQNELTPVIDSIATGVDHNNIKNCIIFISGAFIVGMNIKIKLTHIHQKYVEEHVSGNEFETKSYKEIKYLIKRKKKEIQDKEFISKQ